MTDENPSKQEITTVFRKLRSMAANKSCFDCGANNPTWSSITYGVFICIDCSAIHRGLGVHVSFVRSTQLDTNWTWLQIRAMQVGGNSAASQFFRQHGWTNSDAQQKYKSRAAQLYREKVHHAAAAAMRLHGTKLHIDAHEQISPNPTEEKDFFSDDHVPVAANIPRNLSQASMSKEAFFDDEQQNGTHGPKVDNLDDTHAVPDEPLKKSTIGQRKPVPKKTGMGAKKGKLGAQKVSANFSEIEQQAESLDKERQEAAAARFSAAKEKPQPEISQLSARLMVQDIGKERDKEEERLKHMDPKKVEHMERLGMGFKADKGGVSHSLANDMVTIQQDGVRTKAPKSRDRDYDNIEDEWEILNQPPSSGRRNDGGFESSRNEKLVMDEDDFFSTSTSSNSWDVDESKKTTKNTSRAPAYVAPASSGDALKKFGSAKAISSDMYFGDKGTDYETKSNLAKFEGATGIGSADLFGGGSGPQSRGGGGGTSYSSGSYSSGGGGSYANHMPEVADIKDSVRHGVSKVAGKISSLSSSVQNYMSDNYGGY